MILPDLDFRSTTVQLRQSSQLLQLQGPVAPMR
jgi:hypothetical protein